MPDREGNARRQQGEVLVELPNEFASIGDQTRGIVEFFTRKYKFTKSTTKLTVRTKVRGLKDDVSDEDVAGTHLSPAMRTAFLSQDRSDVHHATGDFEKEYRCHVMITTFS